MKAQRGIAQAGRGLKENKNTYARTEMRAHCQRERLKAGTVGSSYDGKRRKGGTEGRRTGHKRRLATVKNDLIQTPEPQMSVLDVSDTVR